MSQKTENTTLSADKASVEALFSTASLTAYDVKIKNVAPDYFTNFEAKLLVQIAKSHKVKPFFTIPKWSKIAIAASIISLILTGYLFIQNSQHNTDLANQITLQDISTAEMDAYLNENESLVEIDWQHEINKEGKNLETLKTPISKDSNNTH